MKLILATTGQSSKATFGSMVVATHLISDEARSWFLGSTSRKAIQGETFRLTGGSGPNRMAGFRVGMMGRGGSKSSTTGGVR